MGNNDRRDIGRIEFGNKRPFVDTTSGPNGCAKQKTVRCPVGDSEAVIVKHQAEEWLFYGSVPQGGGEIVIIFQRQK
jgi:hypothetical protein